MKVSKYANLIFTMSDLVKYFFRGSVLRNYQISILSRYRMPPLQINADLNLLAKIMSALDVEKWQVGRNTLVCLKIKSVCFLSIRDTGTSSGAMKKSKQKFTFW